MPQLFAEIDESVEITAFTLRKLFLGFLRSYFAGRLLVHADVLKNFKYTGATSGGLRVDLADLEEKDKLDFSTGIYLSDGATQYTEHTIGGRGEDNLMEGSSTFQVEGTHDMRVLVIADSSDETGMLADNVFFFLLALKGMLKTCEMQSVSEIRVKGQGRTARLDSERFYRDVSFHVRAHHSVISLPETHLLQTIDIRTFSESFLTDPPLPPDAPDYSNAIFSLSGGPLAYSTGGTINYLQ